MKWISVKDELPVASSDRLALLTKDEVIIGLYTKVTTGFTEEGKPINSAPMWLTDIHDSGLIQFITHWMELPKPPKERNG